MANQDGRNSKQGNQGSGNQPRDSGTEKEAGRGEQRREDGKSSGRESM